MPLYKFVEITPIEQDPALDTLKGEPSFDSLAQEIARERAREKSR